MGPNDFIAYINADEGATLESARYPFVVTSGSYTSESITEEGWVLSLPSEFSSIFGRPMVDADNTASLSAAYEASARTADRLELQWYFRGISGGTDPLFVYLTDGRRGIGLILGSHLRLGSYDTIHTYQSISTTWDWTSGHVYHLLKHGTEAWELRVDGQRVAYIAYALSDNWLVTGGTDVARIYFGGSQASVEASVSVWNAIEWSVNMTLAPEWKYQKFLSDLPPGVTAELSPPLRAIVRSYVGMAERLNWAVADVARACTSGRVEIETYRLSGLLMPDAEDPAWLPTSNDHMYVARQRLVLDGTTYAGTAVGVAAAMSMVQSDETEVCVDGWFRLEDYTPDTSLNGNTGLSIAIDGANKTVSAYLIETPDEASGTSFAWVLRPVTFSGDLMPVTPTYPINPYEDHHVSLHIMGFRHVLLVVNGVVVAREAYSAFDGVSIGPVYIAIYAGWATPGAPYCRVGIHDITATIRGSDRQPRPLLNQTAMESLIHLGGCEKPDEIQIWKENYSGVVQTRGTHVGIIAEFRRLCCTERVYVLIKESPTGWHLDYTYPDESPVWLDALVMRKAVYIEFVWGSPNFLLDDLALLLATYYVPFSYLEMAYHICLIAVATATIATGTNISVDVESSRGFEVGDLVTLRTFDGTTTETVEVTDVPDATTIELAEVVGTFTYLTDTPPILRKLLRST